MTRRRRPSVPRHPAAQDDRGRGHGVAPHDRAGRPRVAQDDRGVVLVFVAVMATALLLVAGFAFDGGQLLGTFTRANNLADAAARAGAQAIDTEEFRATGTVTLDPGDAQARAASFLAQAGHPGAGSVSVAGDQVTVTVTLSHDPRILPGTRSVSATSTATAVEGVDGASIGGP